MHPLPIRIHLSPLTEYGGDGRLDTRPRARRKWSTARMQDDSVDRSFDADADDRVQLEADVAETVAEATASLPPAITQDVATGLHDREQDTKEEYWRGLLDGLVGEGLLRWRDITPLVLGHLNPPQVGTQLASSEGFKRQYGKGHTMRVVLHWLYTQEGRCQDCHSRLELQADHVNRMSAQAKACASRPAPRARLCCVVRVRSAQRIATASRVSAQRCTCASRAALGTSA